MNRNRDIKRSKLELLIEKFDVYELNRLEKFIKSPYFNKNEKIIQLFSLIRSDLQKSKVFDKQTYFRKIYKTKTYNDQKFRNLSSDLYSLVLRFLVQEELEINEGVQANFLLESVRKKEIRNIYDKFIKTSKNWLDKNKLRDSEYFLQHYKLENNIFKLSSDFDKKTKVRKKSQNIDILKINDLLDYFYMTEKLRYYNSYLSWKTMTKIDYDFPYIDRVIAIVKTHKKELPPALQIYYEIYKISTNNEDHNSYNNLKTLINLHLENFDDYESNMVYSFLLNFAIKQVNKGNQDFYPELFELYVYGLDHKIIYENERLSPTSFRNIITLALRLGKLEWVKENIVKYAEDISSEYRDNAVNFNMARYYFYANDFKKVIEQIREVEFIDPLYAHMSKTMISLSYYELYDEEALQYFTESFRAFMRRSKAISEPVRKRYLNFIKFIRKLAESRYNPSIQQKLKLEIISTKELASRDWFLEKLKDIKLPHEE